MDNTEFEWGCDRSKMEIRTLNRDGFCNCCTRIIKRNDTKVLVVDNWKHGAPNLIFCLDCVKKMDQLTTQETSK